MYTKYTRCWSHQLKIDIYVFITKPNETISLILTSYTVIDQFIFKFLPGEFFVNLECLTDPSYLIIYIVRKFVSKFFC